MNFRDLKAAVMAAQLHDLADTTATAAREEFGEFVIEFDTEAFEEEANELRTERDDLEKDLKAEEKRTQTLEERLERAREALAEIRDPRSGVTLATFIERAEAAEYEAGVAIESARQWQHLREIAEKECKAIRKKKGVSANLFRLESEIVRVLDQIARHPLDSAQWAEQAEQAKKLLTELHK